jgi:heme exporter protein D
VGSQVPVWIPIVVALLGLAGVILTQILSGRRETRRMAEEAAREERRWQREREARTHETRADAYAQLMGVLEAFDGVLFQARAIVEADGKLDEHQITELREVRSEAQHALGPVVLHAPEAVRRLVSDATLPRMRLAMMLLDPGGDRDRTRLRPAWEAGQRGYRVMRARMRADLGFDAEPVDELYGAQPTVVSSSSESTSEPAETTSRPPSTW